MLVDYIAIEKLPHFVIWLDWCFYAYKTSLIVCQAVVIGHYFYSMTFYSWGALILAIFIGFSAWVVVCLFWQGYAVG